VASLLQPREDEEARALTVVLSVTSHAHAVPHGGARPERGLRQPPLQLAELVWHRFARPGLLLLAEALEDAARPVERVHGLPNAGGAQPVGGTELLEECAQPPEEGLAGHEVIGDELGEPGEPLVPARHRFKRGSLLLRAEPSRLDLFLLALLPLGEVVLPEGERDAMDAQGAQALAQVGAPRAVGHGDEGAAPRGGDRGGRAPRSSARAAPARAASGRAATIRVARSRVRPQRPRASRARASRWRGALVKQGAAPAPRRALRPSAPAAAARASPPRRALFQVLQAPHHAPDRTVDVGAFVTDLASHFVLEVRVRDVLRDAGHGRRDRLPPRGRAKRIVRPASRDRAREGGEIVLTQPIQVVANASADRERVTLLLLDDAEEPERREEPHGHHLS
jgi:hypothetical protein